MIFFVYKTIFFVFIFLNIMPSFTNKCDLHMELKPILHHSGFHRNLTYELSFVGATRNMDWLYKDCIITMEQELPPGIYANSDELEDFKRSGRLHAFPKSRVNVEIFAEESAPMTVFVLERVTNYRFTMWMPLHARYQNAKPGGGIVTNEIKGPTMYLKCPNNKLKECKTDDNIVLCYNNMDCDWVKITNTKVIGTAMWSIPIGNTNMSSVVGIGTAIVITVASMYVLYAIHKFKIKIKHLQSQ